MNKKPLIYIADLTYDTILISNETFPIGIGYVVAYANKYLSDSFDIKLFKFPNDLFGAIDSETPDILGMSSFPWNRNLSLRVAEYYKKIKPDGVVVLGGNSLPHETERQVGFFKKETNVDLLVLYDGEYGFLELLKTYLKEKGSYKQIFSGEPIDGCIFWSRDEKFLKTGKSIARLKNLDDIPSPYLTGLMDPFFENMKMTPIVQSTRGCPFSCSYCWAANKYNRNTRHFSIDRVNAELDYIAERRKDKINRLLIFADSNFGMFRKDEEITEKIASLQKSYNFPSSFNAPCGKDNKDRVLRMLKNLKNVNPSVSIQSTDLQIQKNVARTPIILNEYKEVVDQIHQFGLRVQTGIITGLPGETKQTHLQTIKDLIYMGFDEISAFTFMFLEGTELNTMESQQKYDWHKNYRIVPRNFGNYRDKICFEVETVGVGSKTFSLEDYLYLRGFHGALAMIFNSTLFTEFTRYLKQKGVDIFSFVQSFYEDLKEETGPAGDQFRAFLKEVRAELWDSREKLEEYFSKNENYQKLVEGETGDNLLQKYKIISVAENFDSWCEYFYKTSLNKLQNNHDNSHFAVELTDIKDHIMAKGFNIISDENSKGMEYLISLSYDVIQWKKDNYVESLSAYKFKETKEISYMIKEENKRLVKEILELHSKNKATLWKVVSSRYYLPGLFREAVN